MRNYTKHKTFDAQEKNNVQQRSNNVFFWRWEHTLHFSSGLRLTVGWGLFARQPRAKAHAAVWGQNLRFLANLFSMSPTQSSAFTNLSWQVPRLT